MTISYDIDVARRLVRLTLEGPADPAEWFAVMEAATKDPRYEPGFDFLYDRTATDHIPDAMYVRAWVFRHAAMMKQTGLGRLAVIVSQPVVYGMLRMASVFAESAGVAVTVFWTEGEALAWLSRASDVPVASNGP